MIAFFLSCVLSVFSFFFKQSKLLLVILFVFMWVLFGWNYSNADFPMYINMYSIPLKDFVFIKFEGGYSFWMYCCKSLGLSFQQFLIVTSGFVLLLLFRFFYFFSYLPAFLTICFFWSFFPLEYVIFRNFIAFAIVLQGFICVLKKEKYHQAKFVIFVLLASTIHISSLIYLIFLFAFTDKKLKIETIFLWVICLLALVSLSHDLIFTILSMYSKGKAEFYKTDLSMFFIYSSLQVLNLFIVRYFLQQNENEEDKEKQWTNTIILNSNIIMLLLIVVYYELAVFVRIVINMSIVNLVFITNKSFLLENKWKPKVVFLAYLLFWFFGFIFFVREGTIYSLFNYNLLLK